MGEDRNKMADTVIAADDTAADDTAADDATADDATVSKKISAKEYFDEVWNIDGEIGSKLSTLQQLRNLATSTANVLSDMPKAHNVTSRVANVVTKIADLENEINADMEKAVDLKIEAVRLIKDMKNPKYAFVLEQRYLNRCSWEDIACDLDCCVRYVQKLHGRALAAFQVPEDSVLYRR